MSYTYCIFGGVVRVSLIPSHLFLVAFIYKAPFVHPMTIVYDIFSFGILLVCREFLVLQVILVVSNMISEQTCKIPPFCFWFCEGHEHKASNGVSWSKMNVTIELRRVHMWIYIYNTLCLGDRHFWVFFGASMEGSYGSIRVHGICTYTSTCVGEKNKKYVCSF